MGYCHNFTRDKSNQFYAEALRGNDLAVLRDLGAHDLFFLLTVIFKRHDVDRDWLYERCREVEAQPDGMLDLWSREHYKSTVVSYALTIQEMIRNPEITIGIFSHTRPIAKGFLRQIKQELETNKLLPKLWPEIFFDDPKKQSPKWSEDDGIICTRRTSNPKESTVEAWGLVDGQPTSKHYALLLYDDIVTLESVSTPEQIKKTTDAWALSLNLGARGGRIRYVGTRFHMLDTYGEIINRGAAVERRHPATDDGTETGEPVLLTKHELIEKRRAMGPYVFASQMLLNPVADKAMGFRKEWLQYYNMQANPPKVGWNYYLLCDPASGKKKDSDYTVMAVIALGDDGNYYIVDGIRDRLNLTERANALIKLHRKWSPLKTGYEKYGKDSDIEHIQDMQGRESYRFNIIPLGGSQKKEDRIQALVPLFEQGRFYIPEKMMFVDNEQRVRDFTNEFVNEEYLFFPVATHDDMLDCVARIVSPDMKAQAPQQVNNVLYAPQLFTNSKYQRVPMMRR